MNSKRKLLISMLAIVFVLLAVVATIAIAFALTQQTITTTLNIGYVVEDIDGTASATYTIGGVTESLTAMKGDNVIGDTLVFHAGDTEDAGNLMFPEGQIPLSAQNDNIVIQYTYSNTGERHYIASMSFDGNISADNMKVEYSINGTDYSTNRYAVVVPANTANKSYWIKISIENKAKSASFTGDFRWLLSGCDEQEDSYLSLTSVEMQATGTAGEYQVGVATSGAYVGELVFPSSVNGDPVTTIAQNTSLTQEQKNQITSVYIPDSVETIGAYAFGDFHNLETVTFEQNETIGASVQSGTGLTSIDSGAFGNCYSLKEFLIPNTVTYINSYILYHSTSLTRIEVVAGNTKYHSAGNCVIETARKSLVLGIKTSIIPADGSVTNIGISAFDGCTGLTSIEIPNSVTSIGYEAFYCCTGLTSIEIPDSVTILGAGGSGGEAFYGCTGLKSVTIGSGVTKIDQLTFYGCTSLTSITIPEGVTTIGLEAFSGCTSLTSITIPEGVTTIFGQVFYGCTSLTSITIPASVTMIGELNNYGNVFVGCTNLTSAMFENPNGWSCTLHGWNSETNTVVNETVSIDATELSNPQTAAELLKREPGNDFMYVWTRS